MTLIERATKSANSVADQTISTVSQIGTAIAEGVVVTTRDIRIGMREGHIRPRTAVVAAGIGLIAVVEWPLLLAAGGVAVLASKLKKRSPEADTETETELEAETETEAQTESELEAATPE
ncbi:hypothetical protein AWC05_14355 [Mycobacterium florentinum]|uniref:Uncharacterized protein n=1 Tax=Mycobacterium florentinum TaxID=292462 RepID=A0A1X1UDZ0_MYCFL|nr:hypothetical protein [Mycobacterium florentinum]MCV7411969.1 hypothetical protein [Mycobacterium florentinum]ORV55045.1 hypothetical protein AWC05_14355 [Mycobacterium florentinum]BBX81334.1 hypothetical protein MFLOJ_51210 [Mycobacterium florentinum]